MENRTNLDLLSTMVAPHRAAYLLRHDSLKEIFKKSAHELEACGFRKKEINRLRAFPELARRSGGAPETKLSGRTEAQAYLCPRAFFLTEEIVGAIALDAKSQIIAEAIIARGTSSNCSVTPREVFQWALSHGAVSVLVWHNHPSGDVTPSPFDQDLTARLRATGEILGVPLVDHLIVTPSDAYSFAEKWGSE